MIDVLSSVFFFLKKVISLVQEQFYTFSAIKHSVTRHVDVLQEFTRTRALDKIDPMIAKSFRHIRAQCHLMIH